MYSKLLRLRGRGQPAAQLLISKWRGVRVVEGTSLENWQACERFEGSNPSLSSIYRDLIIVISRL
jgi:hypothetical protein